MKKTILVIEDNSKHRFLFEDILTDEGYEVVTAKDGDEVQKKMNESKQRGILFDLLLVDFAVPKFDPIEFIKINKGGNRILGITAFFEKFDLKEILAILEEQWIIKKPFDTNILIRKVKERIELPI